MPQPGAAQLRLELPAEPVEAVARVRSVKCAQPAPQPRSLTLAEAALMMRSAVKDKSYRVTPVGLLVGRLPPLVPERGGATPATIRDYDAVLARMPLTLADKDPPEVDGDDLRDVIDLWADREARTRAEGHVCRPRLLDVDRGSGSGAVLACGKAAAPPRAAARGAAAASERGRTAPERRSDSAGSGGAASCSTSAYARAS